VPNILCLSLSLDSLSTVGRQFSLAIDSVQVPRDHHEAFRDPSWTLAMEEEMAALQSRGTWDLVDLPPGATVVGCRWMFTLKCDPDGTVDRYKARLVAKGYTQTFGVDYFKTFSPVARLNSVRILLSLVVNKPWTVNQLDIQNASLWRFGGGSLHGAATRLPYSGGVSEGV
jgi:hypothetical protein